MIGCGAIARQYLDTARRLDAIEIVAAADRVPARATAVEAAEGIPAMPVADLLASAEVDVVLNLMARKAVDDGRIGAPIAATATMVTPGHERWHRPHEPGAGHRCELLGRAIAPISAGAWTRPFDRRKAAIAHDRYTPFMGPSALAVTRSCSVGSDQGP